MLVLITLFCILTICIIIALVMGIRIIGINKKILIGYLIAFFIIIGGYILYKIISGQSKSSNYSEQCSEQNNESNSVQEINRNFFPITSDNQDPKVILARRLIYLLILIGLVKILKSYWNNRNDDDKKSGSQNIQNKPNVPNNLNNSNQGGGINVQQRN